VTTPVDLPDKGSGIGFDDLKYSPELKRLLAPAGRTGEVDLVDPQTNEITTISGFTATAMFTLGKHRNGSTSADYGGGRIFAIDNETKTVRVIDPATKMITSMATLAAAPDYVRWVESTGEIWVTMPQNPGVTVPTPEIEVLSVPDTGAPMHLLNITFPASGPEALAIDNSRHRAYTNNGTGGNSYAIDLATHMVVETWKNGCSGLTVDLELDEARGFLMIACSSGRLAVLDVANQGKMLGEVMTAGRGVDVSAYNSTLHHMYLAGQDSMDLTIVGVSAAGKPAVLGTVATAKGAQMVASDELNNAWVGDPGGGRLLKIRDTYPATP
jgi:DNA-binding beta-propeller fold protein YncE